ncbi:hypothetical protein [Lacinutrix sp. MEBiC02404]
MKYPRPTILTIFITLFTIVTYSQTIQIYHGLKGTTTIIDNEKKSKFSYHQGDEITIEVINAHPALYTYEFNNEEIEITDPDAPDITGLISVLTTNLKIDSGDKASSRISGGTTNWPTLYSTKIKEFKEAIKKADEIIRASDTPKNINDARLYSTNGGFLYAQKELKKIELIQIEDLNKYVEDWKNKVKSDEAPYFYDKTVELELTLMELYDNHIQTLANRIIEIKNSYGNDVSTTKSYTITLNSKINKITLNVKAKNENINIRETGEELITIELTPYFKRPILELVPMALMHKSKDGKLFSIENGLINEASNEEFNFSVGATLNLNLLNWGEKKEFSLGTGIGFALAEDKLDNFFFNANVNYRNWVRFGVGYGFLRTATGLKNDLKAGDAATNISDISDVITFERKPAIFFTFVIPGLSLPISK